MDETLNLPDGEIIPMIRSSTPLSPAHDWSSRLRDILDELVDKLEKQEDFGFFDSIIDVQTHAILIDRLMKRYVQDHNRRWSNNNGEEYTEHPNLITSREFLEKQWRGGYSVDDKEKITKVLLY